ncbi:MAG: ABC transporter ATPase [Bacteroidia bacterium]|nr:ABC transporter ATPase [Bacteroidia bacterium]
MKTFNQLPAHSRVWIYQSTREFTPDETDRLKNEADKFIEQWTSHGRNMDAAIEILYNRFIIIAVDEQTAPASGCGIDKSLRFLQNVEKQFDLSLLNRTQVAYKIGTSVYTASLADFEKLINTKQITENTIVFNNLTATKGEMNTGWEVPLKQSWHSRMLVN